MNQESPAGIGNYIPQFTVGCNYLSLPEIPASGTKVLICSIQRLGGNRGISKFVFVAVGGYIYLTVVYFLCVPNSWFTIDITQLHLSIFTVYVFLLKHRLVEGRDTSSQIVRLLNICNVDIPFAALLFSFPSPSPKQKYPFLPDLTDSEKILVYYSYLDSP